MQYIIVTSTHLPRTAPETPLSQNRNQTGGKKYPHLIGKAFHPHLATASPPQPPLPELLAARASTHRGLPTGAPLHVEPHPAARGRSRRRHAEVHRATVSRGDREKTRPPLQAPVREAPNCREVHLFLVARRGWGGWYEEITTSTLAYQTRGMKNDSPKG